MLDSQPTTQSDTPNETQAKPESRLNLRNESQHGPGRKQSGWLFAIGTVAVLVAGGFFLYPRLTDLSAEERDKGWLTAPVSKQRLVISVTEDGNVESASNIDVKCEVAGGSTILWIVEDGKNVVEGEELVRLDQATIEEQLVAQKIVYERALATKIKAEQDFAAADIAVKEYVEGTYIQEKQALETTVTIAEENLRSAKNVHDHTQRMFRKGFVTALQLEADEFAVKRSELELESAKTALEVLKKFTRAKMVQELEAIRDATAAQARSEDAACTLEKDRLDQLVKQKEQCLIKAPKKGMVVYANERGRRGNVESQIEEGAAVREGQALIRLPDLSQMQVVVKIHESKVEQIKPGAPATIKVQGREYSGKVVSVANQPESKSWFSSDVKEYSTIVAIDGETKKLKPGMTAQVEIFVADLTDELTVPVSAVVEQGGQFYVWVVTDSGPERRPVLLGATNDKVISLRDGVTIDEEVFLNPRAVIDEARRDSDAPSSEKVLPKGIPSKMEPSQPKESGPSKPVANTGGKGRPTLASLDGNGDGKISKDEAPAWMKGFFDQVDTDKDGSVGATEWAAMQAKAAQRRQQNAGAAGGDNAVGG
ncbi:HlyD family efflux transporter periplasmic adaptor subunit [Thalassoroseus pseudoceratinae]|uniref:HlyD family efflux transporter periplasmic adaptor subunit n=1 Tax=Thalassoroseus pseudoceratinae TaxID=2713176 RepID=UPI001423F893|nr:HlyD family efflux transporter periplasmic adaptor subunit [Thalassoroseus pseudoceratinae]